MIIIPIINVFDIVDILYIIKYMKTAIIYSYFETDQTIFNMEFYSKHGIINSETENKFLVKEDLSIILHSASIS